MEVNARIIDVETASIIAAENVKSTASTSLHFNIKGYETVLQARGADFSNPQLVRVIVEWETELGEGSGPTYWVPDTAGSWSLATVEPSP